MTQSKVTIAGGKLEGTGTITGEGADAPTLQGTGVVSPGDGIGTLSVNGGFLMVDGMLLIEIADADLGQFDVLNVTGPSTFAGARSPSTSLMASRLKRAKSATSSRPRSGLPVSID